MIIQKEELFTPARLDETRLGMTLLDVFGLLRSNRCNFTNLAEVLKSDQKMVSKLLGKVNSPLFGLDSPVKELQHGLSILGFKQVRELILGATNRSFYHNFLKVEGALKELKKHSVAVACFADELAKATRQSYTVEFYQAGLLHDLGKYQLYLGLGQDYMDLVEEAEKMNYSLYLHERDKIGIDHCELGYYTALEWGMKDSVASAIRYHHEITEEQEEDLTTRDLKIVQAVSFANLMAAPGPSGGKRMIYRKYLSDLPAPPMDLSVGQLTMVSDLANNRYNQELRSKGFLD